MPPQLEVAPHVALNPRKQPCPSCGGKGCVERYPHDRIAHTYCFRCGDWQPINSQSSHPDPTTAAQRALDIETEKKRQHDQAARLAAKMWNQASPANADHPYLVNKGIKVLEGIRQQGHELLIPLQDMDGKLWNVQRISPDGE